MVLGKLMKLFNDENRMAALLRNVEVQDSSDVERIAAKLSVSTKTVRNDVKELNCLMGGYAVISNKKGQYKLIVFDQKDRTTKGRGQNIVRSLLAWDSSGKQVSK